jgi:porin
MSHPGTVAAAQTSASEDMRAPTPPVLPDDERSGIPEGAKAGAAAKPHDDGIELAARFDFEVATNIGGGARRRVAEADQLVLGATVDAGKLLGVTGGMFQATITYRHGKDLGAVADLGTLQQVQEVYGRGQTWRLTQLWYSQVFAGGAADVKLGRLTQGEDFGDFPCQFMNLSFCGMPAGNLVGDYWFNWPVSQWGARLRVRTGRFYVMAGAYEDDPRDLDRAFAVGHVQGATGVLAPVELGYNARRGSGALPGTYKLGGWYNSSDGDDVRLAANRQPLGVSGLPPLRRSGRYGVYLQIQQQLSGSAENGPDGPVTVRGLVGFINVTQADRQTSLTDNQVALGLSYTGMLTARPKDQLGLAIGRTNFNGRAEAHAATPGRGPLDAEYVFEFDYGIHATDWLTVRPNIQYVVNPGGNRRADGVVILGLKGAITI